MTTFTYDPKRGRYVEMPTKKPKHPDPSIVKRVANQRVRAQFKARAKKLADECTKLARDVDRHDTAETNRNSWPRYPIPHNVRESLLTATANLSRFWSRV
jgi:hypothetical protein